MRDAVIRVYTSVYLYIYLVSRKVSIFLTMVLYIYNANLNARCDTNTHTYACIDINKHCHDGAARLTVFGSRVFTLKTDSGHPKDAGVGYPGKYWEFASVKIEFLNENRSWAFHSCLHMSRRLAIRLFKFTTGLEFISKILGTSCECPQPNLPFACEAVPTRQATAPWSAIIESPIIFCFYLWFWMTVLLFARKS